MIRYCTFDHPDPVLRSSLKVESPFRRGTLERPGDLKELWTYVFETLQVLGKHKQNHTRVVLLKSSKVLSVARNAFLIDLS